MPRQPPAVFRQIDDHVIRWPWFFDRKSAAKSIFDLGDFGDDDIGQDFIKHRSHDGTHAAGELCIIFGSISLTILTGRIFYEFFPSLTPRFDFVHDFPSYFSGCDDPQYIRADHRPTFRAYLSRQ
jgi:hypothetical protein